MTADERSYVCDTLENEGIHYGLTHYTDFKDKVRDPEFFRLLANYHAVTQQLLDYVGFVE